eukprot:TRINITY_DN6813_c0_g2_i1.p1 TRINITY_DN6813_c0_g2~~TRINITY_DN6813_c0_g2_i1.p1  ORF type:complete len:245 (+),score=70.66 TRINITY_DN6813_c0_g2_i1:66-800(+)
MLFGIRRTFSTAQSKIKHIGVVGAGQMGTGIAIVANRVGGLKVSIVEGNESQRSKSRKFTESWLDKEIEKKRLTAEEKHQVLERFTYTQSLEDLRDSDFIIEAVTEDFEVKKKIFQTLDRSAKPSAILASNTSSISITKIAGCTQRPGNVVGMHFMNPVPVMKLIEIIRGLQTSDETLSLTKDLATSFHKEIVEANDYPGFITNRVLMPYINEAVYALYEGVSTKEGIDTAMKLGTNGKFSVFD